MSREPAKIGYAHDGHRHHPSGCGSLYATLLRIPSLFERLVYVASLAKSQSDMSKSQEMIDSEACAEVRAEHMAAFEDWLSMSLRDKQADIELCATNQGRTPVSLLLSWTRPENHESLIPASALPPQRDLFDMELKVLFLVV